MYTSASAVYTYRYTRWVIYPEGFYRILYVNLNWASPCILKNDIRYSCMSPRTSSCILEIFKRINSTINDIVNRINIEIIKNKIKNIREKMRTQ